jgi:hypothetical protein
VFHLRLDPDPIIHHLITDLSELKMQVYRVGIVFLHFAPMELQEISFYKNVVVLDKFAFVGIN